jgi:hypothetical protein
LKFFNVGNKFGTSLSTHISNFDDIVLRGSKVVGVTIESYGKVEISYINVDNFYMDNDRDIKFDIVIGHH